MMASQEYSCCELQAATSNGVSSVAPELEKAGKRNQLPDDVVAVPHWTQATVDFPQEFPRHIDNKPWHEANGNRHKQMLRDPIRELVEILRSASVVLSVADNLGQDTAKVINQPHHRMSFR